MLHTLNPYFKSSDHISHRHILSIRVEIQSSGQQGAAGKDRMSKLRKQKLFSETPARSSQLPSSVTPLFAFLTRHLLIIQTNNRFGKAYTKFERSASSNLRSLLISALETRSRLKSRELVGSNSRQLAIRSRAVASVLRMYVDVEMAASVVIRMC